MRNPSFFSDFLPKATFISIINRLSANSKCNFVEKAKLLGLVPASDFRHADLCGCDFSNCDLRSFDFTGADLRGAYGVSIIWDSTTEFSGALLGGSPFASEVQIEETQLEFPEWEQAYLQVSRQDEASAFRQIVSMFKPGNISSRDRALFVLKKLFFNTSSIVVRNNMLYCFSSHVQDASETREFLAYLVAKHSNEPTLMRSAVRVMAEVCFRDPAAIEIFFFCLKSRDKELRQAAIRGLVKAPAFEKIAARLCLSIAEEPLPALRKYFLEAFCRRMNVLAGVSIDGQVIDFAERISSNQFESLAVSLATSQIRNELRAKGDSDWVLFRANIKEALPYQKGVRRIVSTLQELGLPIFLWSEGTRSNSHAPIKRPLP